jgi:cob(I)alamin adenosyltransferase
MKIYTKTGDKGQTSLFGGRRVSKANLRIETYGTIDELNANVGLLRDLTDDTDERELLYEIQNKLFVAGAILASDPEKEKSKMIPDITESDIDLLERKIDLFNETLEPLQSFILPGGHINVSQCHVARCVCRRAERMAVALSDLEKVDELIIKYLNRLSDLLFVLARKQAKDRGVEEIKWLPK